MTGAGATADSTVPRLRCFRIPQQFTHNYVTGQEALRLFIRWLGVALVTAALGWYVDQFTRWNWFGYFIIAAAVFGVGPSFIVHLVILNRARTGHVKGRAQRVRHARLEALVAAPDAVIRFPHRVIEEAISRDRRLRLGRSAAPVEKPYWPMALSLSKLPAGTIVLGADRQLHGRLRPGVIAWPFEPIDARDAHDRKRIEQWEKLQQGRQGLSVDDLKGENVAENTPGLRVLGLVSLVVAVLALAVSLLRGGIRGQLSAGVFLLFVAWLAAIPFVARVFIRREKEWLVPGGFVHSRHDVWRKRGQAIYAARERTPILVDLAERTAFVRVGADVQQIPFAWPHLIAWVASAPSPSVEAVQALVGEDVELMVAG
jgi:hypothetical protein